MHPTTKARPSAPRLAYLVVFGALLLLALTLAAPALAAQRPDYTGGPVASNGDGKTDYPLFVPNDYTVSALRFTAAAGTLYDATNTQVTGPGVQYYVKIRLSPTTTPAGSDNRGFTWNPTSQTWVQEREDWTNFPIVTTTTGGAITSTNTSWVYFRFADTTKAGAYYILVSLQPVGGGSGMTQNNAAPPAITVLDTAGTIADAADGFVVHNGVATGIVAKRAEITSSVAATTVWALTRSSDTTTTAPLQIMPDMWTGAPAVSGDFALGAPVGSAFDARLQNAIWPSLASSFTGPLADVNVALGAAETTPPSAPASLTGKPRDGKAILTWGVATDDTAVTSYIVYRWTDAPLGTGYTAMPQAIATVTDGLTYTDTGLTNDTTYHYLVRAEDAGTNVGPRSATADVAPDATAPAPVTAFVATPGAGEVHLSWVNPTDADFAGVKVLRKEGSLPADPTDGTAVYDGTGTNVEDEGLTNGVSYYYAAYAYDTAANYSTAATAPDVVPDGSTTLTLSALPTIVNWAQPWMLSGELTDSDGDPIADAQVDLQMSVGGGAWATLWGVPPQAGTSTYSASVEAPTRKATYRLYFIGDATHSATASDPVTVTPRVKLGAPVAPSTVKKRKAFTAYGALTPKQPRDSKTVRIKCYFKKNGKWTLKKTVSATNSNSGSASRYTARFSLPTAGSWKLIAYSAATTKYAATTSGDRLVRVK